MNSKLLKNEHTKIILGLLWGFGIACIFRSACHGRKCIIYKAPRPKDIENNIYGYNEKCYKYESITTECNKEAITL
jgi:hypothetical protein